MKSLFSRACRILFAWIATIGLMAALVAQASAADQRAFVDQMRQNKIEGWAGKPGALIYAVLRADAVDVVYGTMEGYESLGIPYMPHIPPEKRW